MPPWRRIAPRRPGANTVVVHFTADAAGILTRLAKSRGHRCYYINVVVVTRSRDEKRDRVCNSCFCVLLDSFMAFGAEKGAQQLNRIL
jgi:hypothetical protein